MASIVLGVWDVSGNKTDKLSVYWSLLSRVRGGNTLNKLKRNRMLEGVKCHRENKYCNRIKGSEIVREEAAVLN